MKSLQKFISESVTININEGRNILDQIEWGTNNSIDYFSNIVDKMDKLKLNDLKNIVKIDDDKISDIMQVYKIMLLSIRRSINDYKDADILPVEALHSFSALSDFRNLKLNVGLYHFINNESNKKIKEDSSEYIKILCDKWERICKETTGYYWSE